MASRKRLRPEPKGKLGEMTKLCSLKWRKIENAKQRLGTCFYCKKDIMYIEDYYLANSQTPGAYFQVYSCRKCAAEAGLEW